MATQWVKTNGHGFVETLTPTGLSTSSLLMESLRWLALEPETAQQLSRLGFAAFVGMLILAAILILSKPPKALMKGLILSAFGLCILVSFITSALSLWQHYYR